MGLSVLTIGQNTRLQQIGIGEKIGDFTLKSYQGDTYSMSDLIGKKNVLLIFPRGKVLDNLWCPLCYYQYAEISAYEKLNNLSKKYDLEILFILPYVKDSITSWQSAAQKGLNTIEKWKNPAGYETLTGGVREWADYVREFYPQTFDFKGEKMPLTIPVLMDEDQLVSKALALYTNEWGGTKTFQNIPTVYLIDKTGKVRFKYHSQYTNDRPNAEYIHEYLEKMF